MSDAMEWQDWDNAEHAGVAAEVEAEQRAEAAGEYHEKRARAALARHGFDPEVHAPLTAWAITAHGGDRRRGVIVTTDGQIQGETHLSVALDQPSLWCVKPETFGFGVGFANDVGTALEAVKAATGLDAAHIRYWEVCEGAA